MFGFLRRNIHNNKLITRAFANAIPLETKYNVLTIPSLRNNYSM